MNLKVILKVDEQWSMIIWISPRIWPQGFPGGSVVKNPPANAGGPGLTTGPGKSHIQRNNYTHVPQLPKPELPRACALQQDKPLQWQALTPQPERSACSPQLEKGPHSNEDPAQPEVN